MSTRRIHGHRQDLLVASVKFMLNCLRCHTCCVDRWSLRQPVPPGSRPQWFRVRPRRRERSIAELVGQSTDLRRSSSWACGTWRSGAATIAFPHVWRPRSGHVSESWQNYSAVWGWPLSCTIFWPKLSCPRHLFDATGSTLFHPRSTGSWLLPWY